MATVVAPNHTTIQPASDAQEFGILAPLDDTMQGQVSIVEVIRLALESLLANKVRAVLTMLGVIIGVASVIALLAIGNGASSSITSQLQSNGTNTLTIQPGRPSNGGPGNAGASQTMTIDDAEAIVALKLPVDGIASQFGSSAQIVAPAADTNATVTGVTADYKIVNNLAVSSGSFLSDDQVEGTSPVIVLGANVATDLFGTGTAVGQTVRVNNQVLRVIGVLTAKGSGGFGSVDDQSFVPITVAQRQLFGARTPDGNSWRVSSIQIAVTNSNDINAVQSRITTLLRQRHDLKSDGTEDDFRFFNQAEMLESLSTTITLLTAFLASVAGISLLVGGIGIMNIMLVSVTERTREIGLRKAVGARPGDILKQFVVEALVISLAGGVIGLLLGAGVALAVSLTGLLTASVTLSSVLLAVGFSLAVGLFFGIYPAQRAAKLNPIEALRYE